MRLFERLDDDIARHVLLFLRRDRLGNETVPGAIFEARVWRRFGRRFLQLSRDTPSKFDAHIQYHQTDASDRLPLAFVGGLICSPVDVDGGGGQQLFLLRSAHTGRVWAVCNTHHRPADAPPDKHERVDTVLALKHLVQLVSGQNADYDTRLDYFDSLVSGRAVTFKTTFCSPVEQCATGFAFRDRPLLRTTPVDCVVEWDRFYVGNNRHLAPHLQILLPPGQRNATPVLLNQLLGSLRNDDKVAPTLPPFSILLGFYDDPMVAECGGMQVSLHNHNLPKELMPRPKANDPERHLRILGRAALNRAAEANARRTALVVQTSRSLDLAGPSGAPARRPRNAAIGARDGIRTAAQFDNDTLSTGRLKLIKQMADHESREAEANGYVDDQYAGFGEERDEPLLYDSDGAYDDAQPMRSRRTMSKERRAEVLAAEARKAREWMLPSDYEDDDDEGQPEDI